MFLINTLSSKNEVNKNTEKFFKDFYGFLLFQHAYSDQNKLYINFEIL